MQPTVKQYKAGEHLFLEGDVSRSIFIVQRGAVSIRKKKIDQEPIQIAKVVAGGVIGEMSFFDGKARSASAIALIEVEVIEIKFENLEKLGKGIPDFITTIASVMAERLRVADQTIVQLQHQLENIGKPEPAKNSETPSEKIKASQEPPKP